MAIPTTPQEVLIEFLRLLQDTVEATEENLVAVLRGSLLLRHWFGERARPAGDVDLECFAGVVNLAEGERDWEVPEGSYGTYGEYNSLVDFGKAMCRYAASYTYNNDLRFVETQVPADGSSLWTYGTPGERYYTGWVWRSRGGLSGRMQIDLAAPGTYVQEDLALEPIEFVAPGGQRFPFLAYTPEAMLASKLSWIMRSYRRRFEGDNVVAPHWTGEPKDLFDAHLLLTQGNLRPELFQKSLLAFGTSDQLAWNNLQAIFDLRNVSLTSRDVPNWNAFHKQHRTLVPADPVELLVTIADRLEPLLGDFYQREEFPFLLAINEDPVDESTYLIYSDWLEERNDSRAQFLRLFTRYFFHADGLPQTERRDLIQTLRRELNTVSKPWLMQFFGTSARLDEIRQRLNASTSDVTEGQSA